MECLVYVCITLFESGVILGLSNMTLWCFVGYFIVAPDMFTWKAIEIGISLNSFQQSCTYMFYFSDD